MVGKGVIANLPAQRLAAHMGSPVSAGAASERATVRSDTEAGAAHRTVGSAIAPDSDFFRTVRENAEPGWEE